MKVIGRSDRVDLPQLGLKNIHAKIDTGAYTSSIHCDRAEIVNGRLEFVLLDGEHPQYNNQVFVFDKFDQRNVKNSFGEVECRFVIETTIVIHGEEIFTEFTLSNRGLLKFPVLLGRKILRDRFVIDVTKKDLSFKEKKRIRKLRKIKKS